VLRRLLNLPLLGAAAVLIVCNVPAIDADARRTVLVLALASVGVFMNFAGLLLPRVGVRTLVRALGGIVALVVASGFAAMAWQIGAETIAPEAKADPEVAAQLKLAAERYTWLAAAVAYVGLSLALLPPRGAAGREASARQAAAAPTIRRDEGL
jgi:hypothetical protein